jgi:hypothetical protein
MTTARYYRDEAERCRQRAAGNPQSETAPRWRKLAHEYDELAAMLDASESGAVRCAIPSIPADDFDDVVDEPGRKAS